VLEKQENMYAATITAIASICFAQLALNMYFAALLILKIPCIGTSMQVTLHKAY